MTTVPKAGAVVQGKQRALGSVTPDLLLDGDDSLSAAGASKRLRSDIADSGSDAI